jgi:putative phosphoesterase
MFRLGVISDTHDFLDAQVQRHFAGVNHIIHGGDIGTPKILSELQGIAPVTAVAGNTDDPMWRYPETQAVELAGKKVLVRHIVNPRMIETDLAEQIRLEAPDLLIFGHTHKPFAQKIGRVFFFNPGAAGKARFGLGRTVAILEFNGQAINHRYFTL